MIPDAEGNTKSHVNNTKDDGNLHLVGIEIWNFVLSHSPDGIYTDRVRCLVVVTINLVGYQHFIVMTL